jgi:hypothetical protein
VVVRGGGCEERALGNQRVEHGARTGEGSTCVGGAQLVLVVSRGTIAVEARCQGCMNQHTRGPPALCCTG